MTKTTRVRILLVILVVAVGLLMLQNLVLRKQPEEPAASPNWLVLTYGPKKYSQYDEELIIRDFFKDRRDGFFVDVGASHYRINSTTYYLERFLGWSGIAVDAICDYETGYRVNRPNTRFHCFFVGDRSDSDIDFYIIQRNKRLSSFSQEVAVRQGDYKKVKIPLITLNDLLERENVSHLDFLSMDIELAEPAALAGFDIGRFNPSLCCLEAHPPILEQILKYFSKNGYEVIEKYRELDSLNLYFTPKKLERETRPERNEQDDNP